MKYLLCLSLMTALLPGGFALAEFIDSDDFAGTDHEVVIDNNILDAISYEEPSFSRRANERDIARIEPEIENGDLTSWQGQLVVLKEIPYNYPQLTRHTLELRVLNEIESGEQQ